MLSRTFEIVAAAACWLALAAGAQTSRLPANPPTSVGSANALPPPIAAAPAGDSAQHHRARVTYADGLIEVRADNSSLNQILRDISRETGMKISGGVPEQRVFGVYGPASAATVLQTLLDGTNTNMLLKENAGNHAPLELVLSPRTGGATPPPPSSATYDATENEPDFTVAAAPAPRPRSGQPVISSGAALPIGQPASTTPGSSSTPPTMPQPANNVLGNPNNVSPTAATLPTTNSIPVNSLPVPSTAQAPTGIVSAPNPPPAGSTTANFLSQTPPNSNPNTAPPATSAAPPTSPNGVKTPQQIFQELQQLQQQRNGTPQASPQGSSSPQ